MRLTTTKRWMIHGSVGVALVSGGFFAACTGAGPPRPTCSDVRDAGASDAPEIIPYTTVTTDAQPTTFYGMEPDPGPQCPDCTLDDGYEIMVVSDFEDGFAPAWFNYGEPGIFIEPPQAGEAIDDGGLSTGINPPQPWWGLQVATLGERPGGERCGSKFALHMEGGPFVAWGGGYVTRHFITRGKYMEYVGPTGQKFCETPRPAVGTLAKNGVGTPPQFMTQADEEGGTVNTGCMFWASPVDEQPSLLGVNLSEFDGVSLWARRGPSGQSVLRVAMVDINTSEDLALFNERAKYFDGIPPDEAGSRCTRIKGCCRHCYKELEYQEYVALNRDPQMPEAHVRTSVADRCWVEGEKLPHFSENAAGQIVAWDFRDEACGIVPTTDDTTNACWILAANEVWDSWNSDHGLCCPRTMEEEFADPVESNGDPRYGGKECAPYVFHFDYTSGNYCHDPGDILPENNQNRCGEGFEAAINVDTEWKHFRIPWHELRRFTPNKPPFDPNSVWQIMFYFGQGYLDTYVDDVGFYKAKTGR